LAKRRAERASTKKINFAWSDKHSKKEEREKRKEKKDRKKNWLKTQEKTEVGAQNSLKRERAEDEQEGKAEWAELAKEERMAKKLKKGNISQMDFNEEFDL
jgi:ATP-dependent RNA helicase DDX55/SPB4